jgi:hypothetical protein
MDKLLVVADSARLRRHPQTAIGFFAQTIREYLGSPTIQADVRHRLWLPDFTRPVNSVKMGRVPVSQSVTFHE